MNPIFILVGPSGVGKSTVQEHLLTREELGLVRAITTTTRKPRPTERTGEWYWFVTPEVFEAMVEHDEFVEWVEAFGRRYGTSRKELETKLAEGPVLIITDMRGALAIKQQYPDTHILFLDAPREDLVRRIEDRAGTTPEDLERRINRIDADRASAKDADVVLTNPDGRLENTIEDVISYISQTLGVPIH